MTPDDRARLPAPACCKLCAHIETWRVEGVERSTCLIGHPMQIGCPWQRGRSLTGEEIVMIEKKGAA